MAEQGVVVLKVRLYMQTLSTDNVKLYQSRPKVNEVLS